MKRLPWFTFAFAVLAVTVFRIPSLTDALQFDRNAFAQGQWWRLTTAHLTHFTGDHLRWDLLAFIVLGSMSERLSRPGLLMTIGIASVVITAGVWLAQPQFTTYRGLSGIDSALFGFVIADLFATGRRERHGFSIVVAVVALAGFSAKSLFELVTGGTVFVEGSAAFAPVPLAHLLGLAVGIIIALKHESRRHPISAAVLSSAHG